MFREHLSGCERGKVPRRIHFDSAFFEQRFELFFNRLFLFVAENEVDPVDIERVAVDVRSASGQDEDCIRVFGAELPQGLAALA